MELARRYYEELFFNCDDERELTGRNQDAIIELLNKNDAVGVFGLHDGEGYPFYFISGFALTALGYVFSELLKATDGSFLNLVYEKDRQFFCERIREKPSNGFEFRMVHASGRNIWVKFYYKSSVSIDGKPILVASLHVIDDARKRESELLDALTKGYNRIIYVDVNQGHYRVIKSEEGVLDEQVFGTIDELHELLEHYGRDFINPEDYSFAEILNKLNFFANPGERGGNYQATYQAKVDGEYQWVQFQAFYGGAMHLDTGHFILTFRVVDAEKKKELEAHRLLSDTLAKEERARHAKNQFLSRMSHDLRTPINGIVGMLQIAKKNQDNLQVVSDCLDKISMSCDTLMSLVQDVLDLNNLEHGEMELSEENMNLHTFLTEDLKVYAERAQMHGFCFTTKAEGLEHSNIIGSPKHILQIFEHILDNAMKYNKPNGSITLSGRELSRNEKMATFEFVVEDTGIGMEPEFAGRIFEPFEQEQKGARTTYMGTGLGMSIVKILVEKMSGTVAVESRLGEGTKVTLTIPFVISEEAAGTGTDLKGADFSDIHVLLVEDNEMNMEIAQFLLENKGMQVTCAVNGQEAVERFSQSEPGEFQVVLMDIMMPVMDGLEAAKRIRQMDRPDARSVCIIALSANVLDSDVKKSKMAGMDEHLPKPINTDQLFGTIYRCFHGEGIKKRKGAI